MKHLLGYKLFESGGETYTSISLDDLESKVKWVGLGHMKDLRPSKSILDKIVDEFPFLRIVNRFYSVSLQDIFAARFEIDIYEADDEWFYLGVKRGTSNDNRSYVYIYKCDQLDGLFDCIRFIVDCYEKADVINKHLRLFENFSDIDEICKRYGIKNYTISNRLVVDVSGDVDLRHKNLTKLPVQFGKVTGDFYCNDNRLVTLEGSPSYVGGDFNCYDNELTSLKGSPTEVGRDFYCYKNNLVTLGCITTTKVGRDFNCSHNKLRTLEGAPKEVGGDFNCFDNQLTSLLESPMKVVDFYCSNNKLTTLEGCPKIVKGNLYCRDNNLITLEGAPTNLVGSLMCWKNPIYNVYSLFGTHKEYIDSLDYNYLRGTNIVKSRFKEALEEIDVDLPENISGYNYI